ncbi:MAG: DMT family transporter [Desulfobacteraceae bacterium]|nr:DMT family transporter [Desulfobacteraceae bacterium]MCF8093951.1 DMT family transporter [Desulfobacteraceae bacterium]
MPAGKKWLPVIGLGILAFLWGYNWVVMKTALAFCGPFAFGSMRAIIGGAMLFLVAVFSGRSLALGSLPGVLLLGFLQTTGFFGFSIWALVSGGAGKTVMVIYTMPFWILLLARPLLGERIFKWQWLAVGFAFTGLVCLFHPWQTHPHLFSTILAALAGLSWALAGVWNKYFRGRVRVDLITVNAVQLMAGAVPLLLIAVFVESEPVTWTPYFIAALVYNAVLATALCWTIWFFVLQELPAGMAGLGTLATPVMGVLAAWLQLGEVPIFWEAVGMILIFLGLAVLCGIGAASARAKQHGP